MTNKGLERDMGLRVNVGACCGGFMGYLDAVDLIDVVVLVGMETFGLHFDL